MTYHIQNTVPIFYQHRMYTHLSLLIHIPQLLTCLHICWQEVLMISCNILLVKTFILWHECIDHFNPIVHIRYLHIVTPITIYLHSRSYCGNVLFHCFYNPTMIQASMFPYIIMAFQLMLSVLETRICFLLFPSLVVGVSL